jgi:hypothetical protein
MKRILIALTVFMLLGCPGEYVGFTEQDFAGKKIYLIDYEYALVLEMKFLETGIVERTILPDPARMNDGKWSIENGKLVIRSDPQYIDVYTLLADDNEFRYYTVNRILLNGSHESDMKINGMYYDQVTGYYQVMEAFYSLPPNAGKFIVE